MSNILSFDSKDIIIKKDIGKMILRLLTTKVVQASNLHNNLQKVAQNSLKILSNNKSTGKSPSRYEFAAEMFELIGSGHGIQYPVTATVNWVELQQHFR